MSGRGVAKMVAKDSGQAYKLILGQLRTLLSFYLGILLAKQTDLILWVGVPPTNLISWVIQYSPTQS